MEQPVMIYDGDCEFCRRWIARWRHYTGRRIAYEPYQRVADQFPQISPQQFKQAVQLIEPGGRVSSGAHAVFRSLALAGRWRWLLGLYRLSRPFAAIAEAVYRFVARHRSELARVESAFGPSAAYRLRRE